jgi:beta-lactamase class A
VDVTDLEAPRVAALNGDQMFYAASLPKLAVMLAVFEKLASGELPLDDETWVQLVRMIRESSNEDSTALMHKVGKAFIADVLLSPRYRLYDFGRGGGLWAGKDYAQAGLWLRDPLNDLSHGATAMQVARFFYLLDTGQLVNRTASREMKRLLGETSLDHKFVAGLRQIRPHAAIYRKSGTWHDHHADSALVERRDGTRYIAVALAHDRRGGEWLQRIIQVMDSLLPSRTPAGAGTAFLQTGAGG